MVTGYTGLLDPSTVQSLREAAFRIDHDDAGWIAEYAAGSHRVRVESFPGGWMVSHVRVVGSLQRPYSEAYRTDFAEAAELAVGKVTALNDRLRLVGSVAAPLLAGLRRTS